MTNNNETNQLIAELRAKVHRYGELLEIERRKNAVQEQINAVLSSALAQAQRNAVTLVDTYCVAPADDPVCDNNRE